ncbi:acyl-CoA dehydrogenase family protein [Caballeronia sp. LZ065]|uniref:acyl-CoA dehydrogenase family protein n=1 Tax=Caballeronia sp. LZ065 TaxID=3038571 RepID=UPI00285B1624|nr:acyl-CoA dehydrogenase family protein [Caballeronia sp. LZ065]MDR5781400.1 acyl-CoA dehydrogenase family protein [Caballeronia sp. LZ065]
MNISERAAIAAESEERAQQGPANGATRDLRPTREVVWQPQLNAAETRWRDLAAQLSATYFAPLAAEIDASQRYPLETVQRLRDSGIASMVLPARHGGGGASLVAYCVVVEEIAQTCASTSGIVATIQLGAAPLLLMRDEALKSELLRGLIERGEAISFALSERHAGSDPASMQTLATPEDGGWRIRGEKCWIGGGGAAHWYVVFAQTEAGAGKHGIAAFLVDAKAPGVDDSQLEDKMGMRGTRTATIELDTWVAQARMLAPPGEGLRMAFGSLDVGRIGVAAQACGMALAAFRLAVEYAAKRRTFGQLLIDHQALGFNLADLAARLSAARALTYEAARAHDNGRDVSVLAAQAKLIASETSHDVIDAALQIFGGAGYVKPNPVERLYRDQRVTEIYEGTSEIQRLLIARAIRAQATGESA